MPTRNPKFLLAMYLDCRQVACKQCLLLRKWFLHELVLVCLGCYVILGSTICGAQWMCSPLHAWLHRLPLDVLKLHVQKAQKGCWVVRSHQCSFSLGQWMPKGSESEAYPLYFQMSSWYISAIHLCYRCPAVCCKARRYHPDIS